MRGRDRKDGDFQNTDYFLVKCVCVAHLLHLFPKMCFFFCFIYKVLFFKEKSQKNWETIIHFFSSLIIFILLAQ